MALLNVISATRTKKRTKLKSVKPWVQNNVRIQVKPELNKFHIFLRFHIFPQKYSGMVDVFCFVYGTGYFLVQMVAVAISLSHVPKSFSLNLTLPEQKDRKKNNH